ncbi:hypothetical protein LX32DRAFT_642776 [Colletotrichum zoysiae]|uniref:NACHT-NTPase and P-loop NTPases N-terminal domain-containing protein n=1 Tax=Colletotrichum zoysiae TaxID=1216348 RepID=A0AAD9HCG9_9PEZI|nr:hypothetical protein LX32DRAFT_642776 [Colletotrichum zoysiae]
MAEVFGVVVTALTVAEMAGKFGGSIVKLKKLWDEVQDVPNEIARLVRQLELLRPVLAEMESGFTQQTHKACHNSAANLSMEYCQQAVAELDALAEDLRSRIDAAKRSRRNITKLKVTFKKEQIRGYQEKIQFALQLLSLSQQTYTISLVKSRFLTFPEPASRADAIQTITPQHPVQPESASENTLTKRTMPRRTRHELTTPAMPLWRSSFFGGFVYRTVSDPDHTDTEVHQARVQLPRWISETFWDFQAYRAYTGWNFSLKPWTVRPSSDPIFQYVSEGSLDDVLMALESNEASLQDINEQGQTLLHKAIFHGHHDITKRLVDMGLSLGIVDYRNLTPWYLMGIPMNAGEEGLLSLLQFLLDTGELDDEVDRCFMPEGAKLSGSLTELIWLIPGFVETMAKRSVGLDSYYRLSPDARFKHLDWSWVQPDVLLDDLRKCGALEPADFRPVFDLSDASSLALFAWKYFYALANSHIHYDYPNGTGGGGYFGHWRDLARWVFAGLSAEDFSRMEKSRDRLISENPIVDGLVEWQCCLLWVSIRSATPRFAQKAFLIWLEDVRAAGVDLAEYGRLELEMFLAHGSLRGRRWFHRRMEWEEIYNTVCDPDDSGWRLVGFTYGPEPRDWGFTWDLDAWEYAGDFWELVENPPLHIPGGWVDD